MFFSKIMQVVQAPNVFIRHEYKAPSLRVVLRKYCFRVYT